MLRYLGLYLSLLLVLHLTGEVHGGIFGYAKEKGSEIRGKIFGPGQNTQSQQHGIGGLTLNNEPVVVNPSTPAQGAPVHERKTLGLDMLDHGDHFHVDNGLDIKKAIKGGDNAPVDNTLLDQKTDVNGLGDIDQGNGAAAGPQDQGQAENTVDQTKGAAAGPQDKGAAAGPQDKGAAAGPQEKGAAAGPQDQGQTKGVGAMPGDQPQAQGGEGPIESQTIGTWEMFSIDSGVSAMHMQIMPNNKAIMYDAASLGPSNIKLPPNNCRFIPPNVTDCFAHGVAFDTITGKVRPLKVLSDIWCSSGGLDPTGTLVSTGGWFDGERSVRYLEGCDTCDFRESTGKLGDMRWYATQVKLPNGKYVLVGGRRAFNIEFVPEDGKPSAGVIDFPLLRDTTDLYENNLYPFVHLAPDGNLFILANTKSVLLDPVKNVIVRTYPDILGGARNYPSSGSAALLPLKLKPGQKDYPDIEILVCGGGQPLAFGKAEQQKIFDPALDTCGRMKFMQQNAQWEMDKMPSPRIMGDMLLLPNGQVLMINGAQKGSSGWTDADDPNFTPVLYSPEKPMGQRFRVMGATIIARMYHSSSAVLIDGKILVAGSNTNPNYQFGAKFPTEVRVEKFSPPYLDKALDQYRPVIDANKVPKKAAYGQPIVVPFTSTQPGIQAKDMTVVLYKPPFTTHGYCMDQRMVEMAITSLTGGPKEYTVTAEAPNGGHLAPPGFYYMFLTYRTVPGVGSWIQLL